MTTTGTYLRGVTRRPARTIALVLAILWIAWVVYETYAPAKSANAVFLDGTSIFAHAEFIVEESSIGVIGFAVFAWLAETSGILPARG